MTDNGPASTAGPAVRLVDLGEQLKRRWRVVLLTVVACVVLSVTFAVVRPAGYTATSVLTVNPITAKPFGTAGGDQEVNITTERAVIQSTEVAQRAREIMGSAAEPRDLVDRIRVTSPMQSQVLEINASAGDPAAAAATANAFANGYLDVRAGAAAENIDSILGKLAARIAELTGQLPADADSSEAELIRNEINNLRAQQSDLTTVALNPGRVITVATPPADPSSLGPFVFGAGGLAAGLLLGLALALLRERLDRTVHSGARLATVTGLPVLDHGERNLSEEFLTRVILRAGLEHEEQLVLAGILGADRASLEVVGTALRDHLQRSGRRCVFAQLGDGAPAAHGHNLSSLTDRDRWTGQSDTVLLGVCGADGLARAAMLGRRVDKVVVTATHATSLSGVVRLVEELTATGVQVDLVVTVSPSATALRTNVAEPMIAGHLPGPGQETIEIDPSQLRRIPNEQPQQRGAGASKTADPKPVRR